MKTEILSSCCVFGGMTEEVHVLESDCPIKRKEGARKVTNYDDTTRDECTCIYVSSFGGGVKPCEFYNGTKKVKRNKRTEYKVECSAISEVTQ